MRPGFMHRMRREGGSSQWRNISFSTIKRMSSFLAPHKFGIVTSVLLLILNSLFALLSPLITKELLDSHLLGHKTPVASIEVLALSLVIVALILWLLDYLRQRLSVYIGQNTVTRLRNSLLAAILKQPPHYHKEQSTGNLVSITIGDVDELSRFAATGLVNIVGDSLILCGGLLVMYLLCPPLALAVIPVFPLLIFGLVIMGRLFRTAAREEREAAAAVVSGAEEGVSGVRVVQSVAAEERNSQRFAGLSKKASKAKVKSSAFFATILPVLSVAGALATSLTLIAGGHLLQSGKATVGLIVAFLWYLRILFGPLRELSLVSQILAGSAASLERIWEVLKEKDWLEFPEDGLDKVLSGPIEVQGITFCYQSEQVLKDISFTIGAGKTMVIAGPSGSGKTTLAWTLARLTEAAKGTIKIGGTALKELSREGLRKSVIISPQEVFLFPGTIRENLLLLASDKTDEELIEALDSIGLKNFINSLPEGLDTKVGEGGQLLSGGQKRLVALGRIALCEAPTVILDEPLAAVDGLTFQEVRQCLERVLEDRTAIITTHRLDEFVRNQDLVLCLQNGKIAGYGKHDELLEKCPAYKALTTASEHNGKFIVTPCGSTER